MMQKQLCWMAISTERIRVGLLDSACYVHGSALSVLTMRNPQSRAHIGTILLVW